MSFSRQKIIIWRGHHGTDIFELIKKTWASESTLLILCPPRIDDLEAFFPCLPSGQVEFCGDFKDRAAFHNETSTVFPEVPQFGIFSSGTTDAHLKLLLYTKKNLETSCHGIFSFFKTLDIKTVFSYPQPYHVFGLSLGYVAAIINNWKLIIPKGHYGRSHHERWIESTKSDGEHLLTLGTPTHFLDALSFLKDRAAPLSSSLTTIAGGAKVEVELWDIMKNELRIEFPSAGYGCSEASPGVTHLAPGTRPVGNGDLGNVLPNGKISEHENGFWYEGDNVTLAIIQKGSLFFPKGRFLLPDTLTLTASGHYYFVKRTDLILNRGGEKFSLEEIEDRLKKELQINCVAVAIKNNRLGEELALIFEGTDQRAQQIMEWLFITFKRHFDSNHLIAVDALPINANAKFDRKRCLEIAQETL